MAKTDLYILDVPENATLEEIAAVLRLFHLSIDGSIFMQAPPNVQRFFKPSVLGESPSNYLN